jgi:hypothetical protein
MKTLNLSGRSTSKTDLSDRRTAKTEIIAILAFVMVLSSRIYGLTETIKLESYNQNIPDGDSLRFTLKASTVPEGALVTKIQSEFLIDDRGDENNFWCSDYSWTIYCENHNWFTRIFFSNWYYKTDNDLDDDSEDDSDIYRKGSGVIIDNIVDPEAREFYRHSLDKTWYFTFYDNRTSNPDGMPGLGKLSYIKIIITYEYEETVPGPGPIVGGLVGHWKLDETSGNIAADSSGNGNNGTLYGNPTWQPTGGKLNGALQFDGVNDYVDCNNASVLNIQDKITLTCWIKVSAFTRSWETILSKGDDSYRLCRSAGTGNSIHFACTGTTLSGMDGRTNVTDNNWHHIAGVYDGSEAALYIDGVLDTAIPCTGQINSSTYNLFIGDNSQMRGRYLTGLVDDVRIYSRALSVQDVNQCMSGKAATGGGAAAPSEIVIGDFEQSMTGWGPTPANVLGGPAPTLSYSTTGATLGNNSLAIKPNKNGFQWSFMYSGIVDTKTYKKLSLDVTWVAAEWGATPWSNLKEIVVNSDGPSGWKQYIPNDPCIPDWPGSWDPVNWGNHTRTLTWDFSDYDATGATWMQIIFSTNFGGSTPGKYYIDNVRLIGEKPQSDPNLISWWKLDETSGNVANDSAGNRNGTLYGGPVWQPTGGKIGGAIELDGVNDYVQLPIGSLISSLTDSTFATWVNWSGVGNWRRIFDFGSGTNVNMFLTPRNGTTGAMRFAITTGGGGAEDQATATTALPTGWHHVAVTIDSANKKHVLYLDGSVAAKKTAARYTPSSLGNTTQNWLGKSQYQDPYFNGSLDDFRIYNRALGIDEITQLWAGGLVGD